MSNGEASSSVRLTGRAPSFRDFPTIGDTLIDLSALEKTEAPATSRPARYLARGFELGGIDEELEDQLRQESLNSEHSSSVKVSNRHTYRRIDMALALDLSAVSTAEPIGATSATGATGASGLESDRSQNSVAFEIPAVRQSSMSISLLQLTGRRLSNTSNGPSTDRSSNAVVQFEFPPGMDMQFSIDPNPGSGTGAAAPPANSTSIPLSIPLSARSQCSVVLEYAPGLEHVRSTQHLQGRRFRGSVSNGPLLSARSQNMPPLSARSSVASGTIDNFLDLHVQSSDSSNPPLSARSQDILSARGQQVLPLSARGLLLSAGLPLSARGLPLSARGQQVLPSSARNDAYGGWAVDAASEVSSFPAALI